MTSPAISVLLAVHNGMPHLQHSLESVLSQRFEDFEFIIVDDASTDGTETLLLEKACRDNRLKILHNSKKAGLTRALNRGLAAAQGDYVARIDADDVCRPDRLGIQLATMVRDPGLVIIGSGYRIIDGGGASQGTVSVALSDAQIRWLLGFSPPTFHPTYFFRRVGPDGAAVMYDESFRTAQDFDLWSRLSRQGRSLVLPDVLIDYRRHEHGISIAQTAQQAEDGRRVSLRNMSERLPEDLLADIVPLIDLLFRRVEARGDAIAASVEAMRKLLAFDEDYFSDSSQRRWMRRTAAGLLADAVLVRGGAVARPADTMRFLAYGLDFVPALIMAVAERPATARKALSRLLKQ